MQNLTAVISRCDVWQVDRANAHVYVLVKLNVISFLADLSLSVDKSDVVELMLPLFVESLEEGEASQPSLLRLKVRSPLTFSESQFLFTICE
jgi:phosphatidylinositol 4-kinase